MGEPTARRAIDRIIEPPPGHWVGDGFPARTYLSPHDDLERRVSPFLLLDYGGRYDFTPTRHRRGVGGHPHRGFETVTLSWEGRIAHHDSAGNAGVIGPGDVQWMTAGSGVLHSEYHDAAFARTGGTLHGVQIWIDLPAAEKMHPPRYQSLVAEKIPTSDVAGGLGQVRVIAGQYGATTGAARTFSPIDLWDVSLRASGRLNVSFAEADSVAILVVGGAVRVNESPVHDGNLVVFANRGHDIGIDAVSDSQFLVLHGTPLDQPVVAHGPFVMNTSEQIHEAIADFQSGAFGHLTV
jgi:quercetin 2,3-dioxygenase